MGRIFTVLSTIAILMIISAGSAVYWLSWDDIVETKHQAAKTVAGSVAAKLSAHIKLLSSVLDKMARDAELIAAIKQQDNLAIHSISTRMQSFLPGAMKLRVLLPGVNSPDTAEVPNMGYADLDQVKETFIKPQLPAIQGDAGGNRHLAITQSINSDGQIIAVLLASLDYQFIERLMRNVDARFGLFELKQGTFLLNSTGNPKAKASDNNTVKVAGTDWEIHYGYTASSGAGNLNIIIGIIAIPTFITSLAFLIGFRRVAEMLRDDQSSVLRAVKDLMTGKPQGSYPVVFDETQVIISALIQFKRVLDNGGSSPDAETDDEEDLNLDDFFDEPEGINFMNAKQSISVSENSTPVGVPVQLPDSDTDQESGTPAIFEIDNAALDANNSTIFRAYDIRGIVDQTLTQDIVYKIGQAIGSEAKDKDIKKIVIARDGRLSSPKLAGSLAQGIMATGRNVLDIGAVPTPVLYFVTQHMDGRTGIMITGSHNPAEYNGLKMVIAGETLANEQIQHLQQRINNDDLASGETGTLEQNSMIVNEYIGTISEDVHMVRPMKIVLDCGNGITGELGPTLLKTLGCEVIELFCEIDGNFPNHHPDPSKPENLRDLITAVQHYEADVGIAFDGDGDRIGIVDSKGKIIWPDRQMMLYAKDVLSQKPGSEIIYDVKCSRHLAEQITKYGGRPLMWKTGHSLIKAKIKEAGARLGGEMSGHIFFNDRWFGFDDALYSAARLIEILSSDTRSSSEVFADFPDSINTPELNVELAEGENFTFMEKLLAKAKFPDAKIITIDGLRADFADGWGLIRASNTTPSLVIRFEADNKTALSRIQNQFKQLMLQIKPDIALPF